MVHEHHNLTFTAGFKLPDNRDQRAKCFGGYPFLGTFEGLTFFYREKCHPEGYNLKCGGRRGFAELARTRVSIKFRPQKRQNCNHCCFATLVSHPIP